MNFVIHEARPDIESGLPGLIPDRSPVRVHAVRPINTNSLAFLVTVLLLFTILNSNQMSPNFLLWLVLGAFILATSLRMYTTCQQLRAQARARARAATASGLLNRAEFSFQMPPSISFASRGRLHGLRLQLALLDRAFDDLDYEALRVLDSDNGPSNTSMSEEEINSLPVHIYEVTKLQKESSLQLVESSSALAEATKTNAIARASEDELTCSICLEQANRGEIIRSLPCLHQFHANCIDPWLRQQGTCPVCKLTVGSIWQQNRDSETGGEEIV